MLREIREKYYGTVKHDIRLDAIRRCSSEDVINAAKIVRAFGRGLENTQNDYSNKIGATKCLRSIGKDGIGLKDAKDLIEIFMEAEKESSSDLQCFLEEMQNHV